MKKRAFTLIELLVVIAIIAILAAILFPVFAQAKISAKKTVGISNFKQISLAMIMYTTDNDDTYPRNDECIQGSSLNPVLNSNPFNPFGVGCTSTNFYYRVNHFSWQKWIYPYVKNTQIFELPLRAKDATNWNNNGQIVGGIVLNTAITGSLDIYNRSATFLRQYRNSFVGGVTTNLADPAQTMVLLEYPVNLSAALPGGTVDPGDVVETVYPPAIREFWRYKLMKGTVSDCIANLKGAEPDPMKIASGGITVGNADGSAKFLSAGKFLKNTPTKLEYLGVTGTHTTGWTFQNDCVVTATGNLGFVQPNIKIDYPMWGLSPKNEG